MSRGTVGLAHLVQVRLARHAKALGADPNLVFTRFAVERFLYRLSRSRYAERFVLKGALLLLVWLGEAIRPTRDADVLGFGDLSDDSLRAIFTEVCSVPVEPDGMRYEPASVRVAAIRRPRTDFKAAPGPRWKGVTGIQVRRRGSVPPSVRPGEPATRRRRSPDGQSRPRQTASPPGCPRA